MALAVDGHGRNDVRAVGLGDGLDRLAGAERDLSLVIGFEGELGPVAGRHTRMGHDGAGVGQHEQAVAVLPGLFGHVEQVEHRLRDRDGRSWAVLRIGQQVEPVLGYRRVRTDHARRRVDERAPVV